MDIVQKAISPGDFARDVTCRWCQAVLCIDTTDLSVDWGENKVWVVCACCDRQLYIDSVPSTVTKAVHERYIKEHPIRGFFHKLLRNT